MTPHEKECALAAIAMRIEKAKTTKELREMRAWYRQVKNEPIEIGNAQFHQLPWSIDWPKESES